MINEILVLFARAGGGGSGSSGGYLLFAIPVVVSGGVASFVKRKTRSKIAGFLAGVVVGSVVSLLYLFDISWFIGAIFATLVGAGAAVFIDKLGVFRQGSEKAKSDVYQASINDPLWQPDNITNYAKQVFERFQHDWSNLDYESIRKYTTQRYSNHIGLIMQALRQMGRKNIVDKVRINEVIFADAHDDINNQSDRVSVAFLADADDRLIEVDTGKNILRKEDEFAERWNFVREGNGWKLDGINQPTEDVSTLIGSLNKFAKDNGMYFSLDWGRLLLPKGGNLFLPRYFNSADVNNHVIGVWDDGILVQLYTCVLKNGNGFTDEGKNKDKINYIIGQLMLPKSYGGILIDRDDNSIFKKRVISPIGYKKVEMEWGDFNKRYTIYATNKDQAASFELLNPSFMAWLYDQDIKVNIEVVDNVMYLYAKLSANEQHYEAMLEILKRSHKELKM
mgnify:CR=1 FL=1